MQTLEEGCCHAQAVGRTARIQPRACAPQQGQQARAADWGSSEDRLYLVCIPEGSGRSRTCSERTLPASKLSTVRVRGGAEEPQDGSNQSRAFGSQNKEIKSVPHRCPPAQCPEFLKLAQGRLLFMVFLKTLIKVLCCHISFANKAKN